MSKKSKKIICTAFANGKRRDFLLLKESKVKIYPNIKIITDTGYQGLKKLHTKTQMPKRRSKKTPFNKTR